MISEYYVAYGYQQLRYVAYWIYRAWNEEKNEAEGEKDIEVEMTPDEREGASRNKGLLYGGDGGIVI